MLIKRTKIKKDMSLFHHISLPEIDPLGGGLAEEITAEQQEPEAMILNDGPDENLSDSWSHIVEDLKQEPDWFDFAGEEE
jgi:hypothetical protein